MVDNEGKVSQVLRRSSSIKPGGSQVSYENDFIRSCQKSIEHHSSDSGVKQRQSKLKEQ